MFAISQIDSSRETNLTHRNVRKPITSHVDTFFLKAAISTKAATLSPMRIILNREAALHIRAYGVKDKSRSAGKTDSAAMYAVFQANVRHLVARSDQVGHLYLGSSFVG